MTLCRRLIDVRDGKLELIPALHAYEEEMLGYSSKAVIESRKQMDSNAHAETEHARQCDEASENRRRRRRTQEPEASIYCGMWPRVKRDIFSFE